MLDYFLLVVLTRPQLERLVRPLGIDPEGLAWLLDDEEEDDDDDAEAPRTEHADPTA